MKPFPYLPRCLVAGAIMNANKYRRAIGPNVAEYAYSQASLAYQTGEYVRGPGYGSAHDG